MFLVLSAKMKYFVLLALVTIFLSSVLAGDTLWRTRGGYSPDVTLNNRQLSARCNDTMDDLPPECLQYLDDDINAFCSTTCGRLLYDTSLVCDYTDSAAYVDFLCAKNKAGKRCNSFDLECDVNPDFCPPRCAQELKENDIESDCCLYTYLLLGSNTTYVDGALDECGVNHTDSCIGAFSGEPIVSAGLFTVSYLILVASLLIVMTL